jgi:hypothetical protein
MASKAWQIPLRVAAGAFILNSGLDKRGLQGEAAQGLHGFATAGHPELEEVDPETFTTGLSAGEIGLGAALLAPFVPAWLAGAGLTAFGLGLNRLYWNAPGLRHSGDVRPTEDGTPIAKDIWLTGIGIALMTGSLADRRRRRRAAKQEPDED